MPELKNRRHEAIALAMSRGAKQSQAYRATYGTSDRVARVSASRLLLTHPEIKKRVEELRTPQTDPVMIAAGVIIEEAMSRSRIFSMLRQSFEKAESLGQAAAMVRATELAGREIGMFKDAREVVITDIRDMPQGVLDRLLVELQRGEYRELDHEDGETHSESHGESHADDGV